MWVISCATSAAIKSFFSSKKTLTTRWGKYLCLLSTTLSLHHLSLQLMCYSQRIPWCPNVHVSSRVWRLIQPFKGLQYAVLVSLRNPPKYFKFPGSMSANCTPWCGWVVTTQLEKLQASHRMRNYRHAATKVCCRRLQDISCWPANISSSHV